MPTGGDTTSAPLEVPRAWMRMRTKDKLTALSYLLDLDGRRASGSVEEVLKGCPHPSEAFARAPLDRVFWVDQLDVRVHQLFEPCHHSVHGLAAVDHLVRSAHKLLVRPSHAAARLPRLGGRPRCP